MDAKHEPTASRRRSRHGHRSSRSPPSRPKSSPISRRACSIPSAAGCLARCSHGGEIVSDVAIDLSGGGAASLFATAREGEPGGCRTRQRHRDPRLRARRRPCGVVAPSWLRRAARQSRDRGGGGRVRRTIPDGARRRLRDRPAPRGLRRRGSFDQRLSRHRHRRRGRCGRRCSARPVAFARAVCARARDRRDAGRGSLRGETWRDDQAFSRRQGRPERRARVPASRSEASPAVSKRSRRHSADF